MKKKYSFLFNIFIFAILITAAVSSFATEVVLPGHGTNELKLTKNTYSRLECNYKFANFIIRDIKTEKGIFTKIIAGSYAENGEIGQPELPVLRKMIEIPVGAEIEISYSSLSYSEYSLEELGIQYPVFPRQPEVPKTGEYVEFEWNQTIYNTDAYLGTDIVNVDILGEMRGVRLGMLEISPITYNPVSGKFRIYHDVELIVDFLNADVTKTINNKVLYSSPYFNVFNEALLNHKTAQNAGRDTISKYPIKYLIISDPMFELQLQPFIEWKIKKGFNVVEAYTDDPLVGTTTFQIKSYIQDLYDNATADDPAPTFVLFVGDIQQIPTWSGNAGGHVTDLFYCEFTNDYFPEIYYGRFSAQTTAQLQPQIDKTLQYEEYTMPDPSYLNEVVMVAGMDGSYGASHGNGQINYGTINYFNEAHGITSHTYLYPESGSNSANIRQDVSNGVTFGNYTAHCGPGGWSDPEFNTGHIPALENQDKYGLLIGNCCSSSEFQQDECFAEAILRVENKGAIGYIGGSNSTYWDPDYYFGVGVGAISGTPPSYEETTLGAYDRAFHTHGEVFEDWYTTQAQVMFAGNLAVTLGDPGSAEYYWEIYHLMGDPSLMIYFSEPPELTVTYDPLIPLGNATFTINTEPYAYAALSLDGVCYGAAMADSLGVVLMNLDPIANPGLADVVVTKQNAQPYIGTVIIDNPDGPFVLLNNYMIDDSEGNNNGIIDYGESIMLNVELKNLGMGDAANVRASLLIDDMYCELTDDYDEWGDIFSQDSAMQYQAYYFTVDDSIPDQHSINCVLDIEDDSRATWSSSFNLTFNAPELAIGTLVIDDTEDGNGNGRLDPGEEVDLVLTVSNLGSSDAYEGMINAFTSSTDLTLNNTSVTVDTLELKSSYNVIFSALVDEGAEVGSSVNLDFDIASGPYFVEKNINLTIGLIVEDFESDGFLSFAWQFDGNQPWVTTGIEFYEGMYSAVNEDINDEQNSVLLLQATVMQDDSISFYKKVSCEDDPYGTGYDYLAFSIDGNEMGRWDGEMPWSMEKYPVTEGDHTFKWEYYKDYSVSEGEDCAWVDYIVFPAMSDIVDVKEIVKNTDILRVYPNPANNRLNIGIELNEFSIVHIKMVNLVGQEIQSLPNIQLDKGYHTIDLNSSSLNAGIYFCVVEFNGQKLTKKIIINK